MTTIQKLIRFCYQLLFFATPLLMSPRSSEIFEFPKILFVYTLTICIVSLWLVRMLSEKRLSFRRTFMDIPLVFFLLSQVVATVFSIDPHTSMYGYYSRWHGGLLSTLSYTLLYWAYVSNLELDEACHKRTLLYPSFFAGLFVALFGIAEHFGIDRHLWVQDVQNRVFSTLGQPNWLAAYLTILLPFTLLCFSHSIKHKPQSSIWYIPSAVYTLLFLLYFICLVYTKSKSGFLAFCVSVFVFFAFSFLSNRINSQNSPKENTNHASKTLVFFGLCVGLVVLLFGTPFTPSLPAYLSRQANPAPISQPATGAPLVITPSEEIRAIVWRGAIDLWHRSPIVGTGVETFAYAYYWTRPIEHNLTSEWDFLYNKAHNEFLNFLATTGLFGLLAYLLLYAVVFFTSTKQVITTKSGNLVTAVAAVYSAIAITNFAGFSVVMVGLWFFILPAMLVHPPIANHTPPKTSLRFGAPTIIVLLSALYILGKIGKIAIADYHFNLAKHYANSGYREEALALIHQALKANPSEPTLLSESAEINAELAYSLFQHSKASKASEYATLAVAQGKQALNISPYHLNFWKSLSRVYLLLAPIDPTLLEKALETLLAAKALAPTDAKLTYNIAVFYSEAKVFDKAIDYYHQTIQQKPNWEKARFELGQLYLQTGQPAKAKEEMQYILENLNPGNQEAKKIVETVN